MLASRRVFIHQPNTTSEQTLNSTWIAHFDWETNTHTEQSPCVDHLVFTVGQNSNSIVEVDECLEASLKAALIRLDKKTTKHWANVTTILARAKTAN
jgi:hypothetical protein